MSVILGSGEHRYRVVENWAKLPDGWEFRDVAAVAVDSKDRVYVFNRGQHPMMVFDRDGNFLRSWGEGLFSRAHGIHIDSDDTLYCTDDGDHTVRKITTDGKVLLTIGVPNQPAPFLSGKPFNRCTHTALSPKGEIYVSDGYGNSVRPQIFARRQAPDVLGHHRHRSRPVQHRPQHRHRRGWLGLCRRPREPSRAGVRRQRQVRAAVEQHAPALCALLLRRRRQEPAIHHRRAGTGHAGQQQAHQHRPAPRHRRQEGRPDRAAGRRARSRPGARPVPVAARPRRRQQGRHLCRRGELHQLAEHPSRRAGAEVPALAAEAREGRTDGGARRAACT